MFALYPKLNYLILRWSRDFFAARLFLFRLSKYLSSFIISGMGRFSPRCRLGAALESTRLSKLLLGAPEEVKLLQLVEAKLWQLLEAKLWQLLLSLLVGLRLLKGTTRLLIKNKLSFHNTLHFHSIPSSSR